MEHQFTVSEAIMFYELVVENMYLSYLQTQYPDYAFEVLGFGSVDGITRHVNPNTGRVRRSASDNSALEDLGVHLNAAPIANYSSNSAYVYFGYRGKDIPLTYNLTIDPTGTTDYHMCGRCSRQVKCCK